MKKGFLKYKDHKIPFVINDFCVELFSDDHILEDFRKEYLDKIDFIINGEYYERGSIRRFITFYVDYYFAETLYLHCYIINRESNDLDLDTIGFESPFIDDYFRYKYIYLDLIRDGINLDVEPKDINTIDFVMNNLEYQSTYRIGRNHHLGLLEDFDKRGELLITLQNKTIQECYELSVIIHRLSKFMISNSEVSFKNISLYKNGIKYGWLYTPSVSENSFSYHDIHFCNFDVEKYIPKILNNIAKDPGNIIVHSIPLGHIGDIQSMFSPQRFIEQVMAFEYVLDKINHKKAQNKSIPLKTELKDEFDKYPSLLSNYNISSEDISENIKEIRRKIAHGYEYHYDFNNDRKIQRMMILLDELIKYMSLEYIGFTNKEILDFEYGI